VRASVGLEEEVSSGYSLGLGEGFAGHVARERRPVLLKDASSSPMVASEVLRARGLRVLYGVPLSFGGQLLGVAHIGSTVADEFPEFEMRLFAAAAQRASFALAKQMYRESAARRTAELEAILRSLPDAVYIWTEQGIAIANQLALDMLGYDRVEELAREPAVVAAEVQLREEATGEVLPLERLPFSLALRGTTAALDVVARHRKTRAEVHLRSSAAPVVFEGKVVGAVVINTDVTHLRELERERIDFMNGVVHDLRNPLQAVRMMARALAKYLEANDNAPLAARAMRIDQHADRMARLLCDLLDLSRATIGKLTIRREPVAYDDLVREVVADFEAQTTAHRIVARVSPAAVEGDSDRLRQVLANLLSNAIKYSPEGGRIEVEVRTEGGWVETIVRDQGVGIRPEHMLRIFTPYYRADGEHAQGHGLGLFVARAIVEAHGGTIRAESEPGVGSTFRLCLPAAVPSKKDE
jgi:signal transduction histidine kinase